MENRKIDIQVTLPYFYDECENCSQKLTNTLANMDGVDSVELDKTSKRLCVDFDPNKVSYQQLEAQIQKLDVSLSDKYQHFTTKVIGMDCPDCSMKLENNIRKIKGVEWVSLNYATTVLVVEIEKAKTSTSKIIDKIRAFGYDVETTPETYGKKPGYSIRQKKAFLCTLSGILILLAAMANILKLPNIYSSTLFIASAFAGGYYTARSGFLSVKNLSLDTNFLMFFAALGAIFLEQFYEAAMVMFLFSLGTALEAFTIEKTVKSISSLLQDFPKTATVLKDNTEKQIQVSEIQKNDIVVIKPGDMLSVDGIILAGSSAINEAAITGESYPVEKTIGDSVYAGSINIHGYLEIDATTTFKDNTISKIIYLVQQAQAQKAPSQVFSEKFGKHYTPSVIFLAILVAVLGQPIFGGNWNEWINRALTLLVVSCPCALVISTPIAIVAALGNAAKNGVLIKGGVHLETLSQIKTIAFDKTGTLTEGKPTVNTFKSLNLYTDKTLLGIIAAIESKSEHPIAAAIYNKAKEMNLLLPSVTFFEAVPGKGARAIVDNEMIVVGNESLIKEFIPNVIIPDIEGAGTKVYAASKTDLLGYVEMTDKLRCSAISTINQIRKIGINNIILLTGDSEKTAKVIADELHLDSYKSKMLPDDKLAYIKQISSNSNKTAMVGDGINDAPALAAANVGIAVGGIGNSTAIEASDITLMANDISMLPYTLEISKKASAIIKQNILFALAVVIVLIAGALTRRIGLTIGVFGHEGSALLVILNSMRLLFCLPFKHTIDKISK